MRLGSRQLLATLCLTVLVAAGPPESPVADAAMRGDSDAIRALLRDGADVNAAQGDGMTALHWAAQRDDAPLADMLLYAGADIEATTRIGAYTPLHIAVKEGSVAAVEHLLGAGASVEAKSDPSGASALHMAAWGGHPGVIQALLAHGADPNVVEAEWGQTPLVFAASQNRAEAIRVLAKAGADVDAESTVVDLVAAGLLDRAARGRQDEVLAAFTNDGEYPATPEQIQAAVKAGRDVYVNGIPEDKPGTEEEDPDDPQQGFNRGPPNITTKGGLTPLMHAARQGNLEAARALIEVGADVNKVGGGDNTSPLLIATINGQFDVAKLLLDHGADPNIPSDLNGVTPLWAVINSEWQPRTRFPQPQERGLQALSYLDTMRELLEKGADPDHRITMHPWYMVYTGCGNGNCGLIDTNGATAFLRAAYATDVAAMRLLIEYGADPMIATTAGAPRQRRDPAAAERRTNVRKLTDEFADLEDEAKLELMQKVRDALPDSVKSEYSDERLVSERDAVREELLAHVERVDEEARNRLDPSGMPPVKEGDPAVYAIHAASGVGYGEGFAGNAHRTVPGGWLSAVKYLVEEVGIDINLRDSNGYNAVHNAAARGDNEMILYLVEHGADIMAVSRAGQTTVDMANSPVSRVSPIPETIALLESLGAINNHNCVACE